MTDNPVTETKPAEEPNGEIDTSVFLTIGHERPSWAKGDVAQGWEKVDDIDNDGVVIRTPGELEISQIELDDPLSILIDGTHTRGMASFVEYRMMPNSKGPPPHWHPWHDEVFYVVSGQIGIRTGDKEDVYGPRSCVFLPRGAVHAFWNPTDEEALFVSTWTPAGGEQNFLTLHNLVGSNEQMTKEKFLEIAREAGTIMLA